MIPGIVANQITAVLSVSPNSWNDISANNPVTSPNHTIGASGVLYFVISAEESDGVEIEYSINNGSYNYIYVTGAGYVSSQSISVSQGDLIKFRISKYGRGYVVFDLNDTSSGGVSLFSAQVEAV